MRDTVLCSTIPTAHEIKQDLRRNSRWIVGFLGLTALWVLLSTCLIRSFENHWGFWHSCYFTIINVTTVGFGDVVPATHAGKIIAGVNSIVGLLLFGIVVAAITIAFQPGGSPTTPSSQDFPGRWPQPEYLLRNPIPHKTAEILESIAELLRVVESPGEMREHPTDVGVIYRGPHAEIEILIHPRP